MLIDGKHRRSIWLEDDGKSVGIIDQTRLPHAFATLRLVTLADAAHAISSMQTRGAPLIGAVAAYGMCLALQEDTSDDALERGYRLLVGTRPTAVNLKWALDEIMAAVRNRPHGERVAAAYARAAEICEEDIAINRGIGRHGLALIEAIAARKPLGTPVNVLTHCNAGWLAAVDWGPATAPIYLAHEQGHPAPRLGRRDPAAQPGRFAHRLRTQPPGRSPCGHRRQCRRAPDAAWAGRSRHHRRRSRHRAMAMSATRSAPI